jgi:23S rRNA pseudouridine2457 synthase
MNEGIKILVFYKPFGVITAFTDVKGRQTLKVIWIFSNDGDLLHRLTHACYRIDKTYLFQVECKITPE